MGRSGRGTAFAVSACIVVAAALAGCAASTQDPLLLDGGFEDGDAWTWIQDSPTWVAPFQIDSAAARTGNASLLTSLRSEPTHEGTAIVGALQEVSAARAGHRIPTSVGGHYRVDAWETDVEHTYVQVVLSFFPSPDASAWCRGLDPRYPCQLAIILAGTDEVPLGVANRVFVLPESDWVGKHEWTYFEYDVGALMQQAWAVASLDYDRLWIYLEVRYDGAQGPRNVAADVRWDDVWLGSALQAHAPRDN